MVIAVDAMGGDFAPDVVVRGALQAARNNISVALFGKETELFTLLRKDPEWHLLPIHVVGCSEVIGMHEEPSRAVLRKRKSSLVEAVQAVAHGKAQAIVSAGNSGALLVASTLILDKVPGLLRPAIGSDIATDSGSIFCLDLGANVDCKPEYLEQFAVMGDLYLRLTRSMKNPRIALLSNGHEAYKGSENVKKAYRLLLESDLNFVGNLEPRDIFSDKADILVCDGFSGNIMLKAAQGVAQMFFNWLKRETEKIWYCKLISYMMKKSLKQLRIKTDYAQTGGALLLGIRHPVVVAHGCSDERAIYHAILVAHNAIKNKLVAIFNDELEKILFKKLVQKTTKTQVQPLRSTIMYQ